MDALSFVPIAPQASSLGRKRSSCLRSRTRWQRQRSWCIANESLWNIDRVDHADGNAPLSVHASSRPESSMIGSTSTLERAPPADLSTKTDQNDTLVVPGDDQAQHRAIASEADKARSRYVYAPLHVHSDYSLLDGASHIKDLVSRAIELRCPALALTDHGVMFGAVELIRQVRDQTREAGSTMKPIIGNEMYYINADVIRDQYALRKGEVRKYHLVVLAYNLAGYRNLCRITSLSHLEGVQGRGILKRPCIHKVWLAQHREGLIVTSACLAGEIPRALAQDDFESARRVAMWFRDTFGPNFYLELQDHGDEIYRKVNLGLVRLSRELHIELVATNDSHFTLESDAKAHDALICIQTGKRVVDVKRLRYSGTEYLKSYFEMRDLFLDYIDEDLVERALWNTVRIAEQVDLPVDELIGVEIRLPAFRPLAPGVSADDHLRALCMYMLIFERNLPYYGSYKERFDHELREIARLGFSDYFLIVHDYITFARRENIPIGPGRGSAASSLVAYLLRITDVDPIRHNLLFERFLNLDRRSLPDVDTDFSMEGRERVMAYVMAKYGAAYVAQIITFNRLNSRSVVRDVARVLGVPQREANYMSKLIPIDRGSAASIDSLIDPSAGTYWARQFRKRYEASPSTRSWVDAARRLEGVNKSYGVHAAGIVVGAEPLASMVPLTRGSSGEIITQYTMEDVEQMGMLKMDFLGLRNLSVIEQTCALIREIYGLDVDPSEIPEDDPATYELMCRADLDGVFQFESYGIRRVVQEVRPVSIDDLSAVLALYRPGPLDAGLLDAYLDFRYRRKPVEYDHPMLAPILQETYGIMLYQEQIMALARTIAGYTMSQADTLRRAMGKKKPDEMAYHRKAFVEGAMRRCSFPEDFATFLFDKMAVYADYCFNKSHSISYSGITLQTAWLKAHFPAEFVCALLNTSLQNNDNDRFMRYLYSAMDETGLSIRLPSVNRSDLWFIPDWAAKRPGDGGYGEPPARPRSVLFGLAAIKNLTMREAEAIVQERRRRRRPYASLADVCLRLPISDTEVLVPTEMPAAASRQPEPSTEPFFISKGALEVLIHAGAFDFQHWSRNALIESLDDTLEWAMQVRRFVKASDDSDWEKSAAAVAQVSEYILESATREQYAELLATAPGPDEDLFGSVNERSADDEFEEISPLEMMEEEYAALGIYLTGTPLLAVRSVIVMLLPDLISMIHPDPDLGIAGPSYRNLVRSLRRAMTMRSLQSAFPDMMRDIQLPPHVDGAVDEALNLVREELLPSSELNWELAEAMAAYYDGDNDEDLADIRARHGFDDAEASNLKTEGAFPKGTMPCDLLRGEGAEIAVIPNELLSLSADPFSESERIRRARDLFQGRIANESTTDWVPEDKRIVLREGHEFFGLVMLQIFKVTEGPNRGAPVALARIEDHLGSRVKAVLYNRTYRRVQAFLQSEDVQGPFAIHGYLARQRFGPFGEEEETEMVIEHAIPLQDFCFLYIQLRPETLTDGSAEDQHDAERIMPSARQVLNALDEWHRRDAEQLMTMKSRSRRASYPWPVVVDLVEPAHEIICRMRLTPSQGVRDVDGIAKHLQELGVDAQVIRFCFKR
ncbi:hypothetical protein F1559_000740 [Cyanidiococcus yangmingshanensis]|uniref:DNA-directed DNA polymerase n=1 Tax=Cyanidiococcus yangmingshanensis TaxID=2690220 RepID=A0A7J7IDP2_9RHOD|nr:hypothetical protein F1559_000740 [Cyanidiococcus yangmingshanensis]